MKVEVDIDETEVEGETGNPILGLRLTCKRCGHEVEVFGTSNSSARFGAFKLREECPNNEDNYYDVDWY